MVNQTAKISKEEARAIYIESVLDRIRFVDRFAHVPSSDGHKEYVVVLQNGFVTKCSCPDFTYRHAFCRHMEATKIALYLQSFKATLSEKEQPVTEPTPDEIAAQHDYSYADALTMAYEAVGSVKHVHCGGCGGICGEGNCQDCKPGFCVWNSWWTEAQRAA